MAEPLAIWVLTDGRAGNDAQALGLAEAVARARPAEIVHHRLTLARWAVPVPAALAHAVGRAVPSWHRWALAEGRAALAPPWPRPGLLIGAGRRVAPALAWMGRRYDIRTVQLLDPGMPAEAFSAVVVPGHDALAETGGANVLTSLGALNRLTPAAVAAAAAPLRDRLAGLAEPRLAVMLGGPSRSAEMSEADAGRLCLALGTLADRFGLIVTPSRRTPGALQAQLGDRLAGRAFLWDGTGDNPYPGMLGLAEAALVTEDSVNMASEAATSGLPVMVFRLARLAPKLRAFHDALAAHGAARTFTGHPEFWTYPALAEADRIAAALARRGLV